MELLSIELGRSIQLHVADEVRSMSGISVPEATRLLTERYGFGVPPNMEDAQKSGLKFGEGRLVSGNRMINIKELGVFNDGVAADTYHTSDSDLVLDDVISWSQRILGTRHPKTAMRRKYVSQIVAILDEQINDTIAAFKAVSEASSAALKGAYDVDIPIALSGASWGSDAQPSPSAALSAEFNFYRRIGRPYSENRFFFIAPIPTDMHIQWIERLEAAFVGK